MLDKKILLELQEYVKIHSRIVAFSCYISPRRSEMDICEEAYNFEIENYIKNNRKPTFNQVLFSFIDKKGAIDSDIYKRAGIDRRHFSKIRSNPHYKIGKNTAIALALALELTKEEMDELLNAAGYSLSDSDTFDLIIRFCIEKKIYDMHNVNEALNYFSLKPLMGV